MRLRVALAAALTMALPSLAHADVQHTVARGHTIEAIANRYKVSVKAIVDVNHLTGVKHLHPGDVLTIPTKAPPASSAKGKTDAAGRPEKTAKAEKVPSRERASRSPTGERASRSPTGETTDFAMKAKTPGVVHVKRVATSEEYDIKVEGRRRKVSPATLKTFEKLMRSPSGMAHPIEPRLVQLLTAVSTHFGSRKIEVVSGFRPFTPAQSNPHSNHMHGKAIDFRVVGVPNEAVRDFCRTLKNVGCGYYPNSVFVHMDVRDQSAFWIDYSKPGEPPRYNAPNVDADEGTSDVHDEGHAATGATPDDAPKAGSEPENTEKAAEQAGPERLVE